MTTQYYLLVVADTIVGPGITTEDQLPPSCIPCTQAQAETWQTLALAGGVLQPIPAATLLSSAQAAQAVQLRADCKSAITGGFSSSALGTANTYPSTLLDQHNLAASIVASLMPNLPSGWTTPYWVMDRTGAWSFTPHTAAQIQQAGLDGKAWVTTQQEKLASLNAQIEVATTVSEVTAIIW